MLIIMMMLISTTILSAVLTLTRTIIIIIMIKILINCKTIPQVTTLQSALTPFIKIILMIITIRMIMMMTLIKMMIHPSPDPLLNAAYFAFSQRNTNVSNPTSLLQQANNPSVLALHQILLLLFLLLKRKDGT